MHHHLFVTSPDCRTQIVARGRYTAGSFDEAALIAATGASALVTNYDADRAPVETAWIAVEPATFEVEDAMGERRRFVVHRDRRPRP